MNNSMYGDPPKKKVDPKASSKINVDDKGAMPKTYPKTRSESTDRNGNKVTTISDSTKKMLFSGNSKDAKTKQQVQNFKADSTSYAKAADYEAKDHNNKKAYENAQAFAGKKKK